MTRYSRKDVETQFERFLHAIGGRLSTTYNDVGAYSLDYNSVYGGYYVVQIVTDTGAIAARFGYQRRKAAELINQMNFAIDAIDVLQRKAAYVPN